MGAGRFVGTGVAVLIAALSVTAIAAAQDETPAEESLGWQSDAEFSYFMADGNAEAENLALRWSGERRWEGWSLTLGAGALRTETGAIRRSALRGVDRLQFLTFTESELTAEHYFVRSRLDRHLSESLFWFVGADWDRNEFAGIDSRWIAQGGLGNSWFDDDKAHFKTVYGVTYTDQRDVVEVPEQNGSFPGLRFSWDYGRILTDSTQYKNTLVVDGNLDDTSDYRADVVNALAVSLNDRLALQVSLQWLYDSVPAYAEVTVFDGAGIPTGETTTVQLEELDTILSTSLVVHF